MTTLTSSGQTLRLAMRAYHALLVLYPAGFRAEYEQEMKDLFQARCLEAYEASGSAGVARWLMKILVREAVSLYKEYLDMTVDLLEKDREARTALGLGMIFLAGTWMALFFTVTTSVEGLVPGSVLVLTNALLVARSFLRAERMEYITGMAAMTNIFLIAGLMAVQSSLSSLPVVAYAIQIVLIGLHGLVLWRLRGEDFSQAGLEIERGE